MTDLSGFAGLEKNITCRCVFDFTERWRDRENSETILPVTAHAIFHRLYFFFTRQDSSIIGKTQGFLHALTCEYIHNLIIKLLAFV
jgi:hypothetical protein